MPAAFASSRRSSCTAGRRAGRRIGTTSRSRRSHRQASLCRDRLWLRVLSRLLWLEMCRRRQVWRGETRRRGARFPWGPRFQAQRRAYRPLACSTEGIDRALRPGSWTTGDPRHCLRRPWCRTPFRHLRGAGPLGRSGLFGWSGSVMFGFSTKVG